MENGTDAVGDLHSHPAPGQLPPPGRWKATTLTISPWSRVPARASLLKFSSPPDYENAGDSGTDNTYTVTLKATAGGQHGLPST